MLKEMSFCLAGSQPVFGEEWSDLYPRRMTMVVSKTGVGLGRSIVFIQSLLAV